MDRFGYSVASHFLYYPSRFGAAMKTVITLVLSALIGLSAHADPIKASFYAAKFEGRKMANGKRYHARAITAASLKYPLNHLVMVTNLETGKVLPIRITDRGPYSKKYSLDLSVAAARMLGITQRDGWGWVETRPDDISPEPYGVPDIPFEPIEVLDIQPVPVV